MIAPSNGSGITSMGLGATRGTSCTNSGNGMTVRTGDGGGLRLSGKGMPSQMLAMEGSSGIISVTGAA